MSPFQIIAYDLCSEVGTCWHVSIEPCHLGVKTRQMLYIASALFAVVVVNVVVIPNFEIG